MQHGSAFMADCFQNQFRFFGMAPSFAFFRPPASNGAAEHLDRTLKEQIVFSRVYQNAEEVSTDVRAYFERYNQHWLLARNGDPRLAKTRRLWMAAAVATPDAA